jgi:hypothetical protein
VEENGAARESFETRSWGVDERGATLELRAEQSSWAGLAFDPPLIIQERFSIHIFLKVCFPIFI